MQKHGISIAICDSCAHDADMLAGHVRTGEINTSITFFADGEALLDACLNKKFDLVFLDVHMMGISGIETAKRIYAENKNCMLVFATNSPNHALEAFGVDAEQYLIKPVKKNDIHRLLKKCQLLIESRIAETVCLNLRGIHADISPDVIIYAEAQNHNCILHTFSEKLETGASMKISDLTKVLLPPQFLHCHRSYIVNLNYVEKVDRDFHMQGGGIAYIRRGDAARCAREHKNWLLRESHKDYT